MKALKILSAMLFCMFTWVSPALAQVSPNQHEMMRQHGLDCNQRYDGCNNKALPQQRLPDEFWENKYGAMAFNTITGGLGVSENESSPRRARKLAIERCGGGRDCVIKGQATNGCLAAGFRENSQGGGNIYYGGGATLEIAVQDMTKNCANGGHVCEIVYAGCSVPIRIR